jgi:hypothetical protein
MKQKRSIAMIACAALTVSAANFTAAREKWPSPDAETRKQMAEIQRQEEETVAKTEAELAKHPIPGKPYLPQAVYPEDLPQAGIPAFPGAEGAGKFSFGGRGGKVFVVTSLEDAGPGTLREACEAIGPRIAIFNVAGIIHLKRPLHIIAPYMTIAGQTAPGDGVCVADRTTHVDTHDVVIRYMRFRRGAMSVFDRDDALGGNPIGNVVVDHCSASWGFDENLSMYRHMYDPHDGKPARKLPTINLTIQWSITSEALDTFHHAFGGIWGGMNTSFHHNLLANNTGRNPSIGMGYDFNFTNNVLFNWRHRSVDGGDETTMANIINNYYKPGPATPDSAVRYRVILPASKHFPKGVEVSKVPIHGKLHVSGNVVEGNAKVTEDNWDGGVQFRLSAVEEEAAKDEPPTDVNKLLMANVKIDEPFHMAPVRLQTATEAYDSVLDDAGATLPHRDPVDVRIIEEVRTGKVTYEANQGIITDIKQIGGFPEYRGRPIADLGADGIPNWWKIKYGLKLNDPSEAAKDCNGDGYTNIEKYLNGIDPSKVLDFKDPKNNVNTLTQYKLFSASK